LKGEAKNDGLQLKYICYILYKHAENAIIGLKVIGRAPSNILKETVMDQSLVTLRLAASQNLTDQEVQLKILSEILGALDELDRRVAALDRRKKVKPERPGM